MNEQIEIGDEVERIIRVNTIGDNIIMHIGDRGIVIGIAKEGCYKGWITIKGYEKLTEQNPNYFKLIRKANKMKYKLGQKLKNEYTEIEIVFVGNKFYVTISGGGIANVRSDKELDDKNYQLIPKNEQDAIDFLTKKGYDVYKR